MARRKSNSPALSLFAFQDIITGVSGVMLFILMLLVVQLALQATKNATEVASPSKLTLTEDQLAKQNVYVEQRRVLSELNALVQKRRSEFAANKANINLMLDANVGDIDQELKVRKAKLEILDDELAAAKSEERRLKSENEKIKANNPAQTILAEIESLQNENHSLETDTLEWQDETRINYATDNSVENLYLYDVYATSIVMTLLPPDDRKRLMKIGDSESATEIATKIRNQYDRLSKDKQDPQRRIVVLIRPSAARNASELVIALREKGFEVAMELLETKAELFRHPRGTPEKSNEQSDKQSPLGDRKR